MSNNDYGTKHTHIIPQINIFKWKLKVLKLLVYYILIQVKWIYFCNNGENSYLFFWNEISYDAIKTIQCGYTKHIFR